MFQFFTFAKKKKIETRLHCSFIHHPSSNDSPSNTSIMASHLTQISSIFLPRVSAYHDQAYIEHVFRTVFETEESPIHHIDLILKEDLKRPDCFYHIAFVFFKPLPTTELIARFAADIESGKRVKVVHSDPWFWNMSKNTRPKQVRKPPRILSEADEGEIKEAQKALRNRRATDKPESPCGGIPLDWQYFYDHEDEMQNMPATDNPGSWWLGERARCLLSPDSASDLTTAV